MVYAIIPTVVTCNSSLISLGMQAYTIHIMILNLLILTLSKETNHLLIYL